MKIELDDRLGCAAVLLALFLGLSVAAIAGGLQTFLRNSSVKYEVKQ